MHEAAARAQRSPTKGKPLVVRQPQHYRLVIDSSTGLFMDGLVWHGSKKHPKQVLKDKRYDRFKLDPIIPVRDYYRHLAHLLTDGAIPADVF